MGEFILLSEVLAVHAGTEGFPDLRVLRVFFVDVVRAASEDILRDQVVFLR